MLHGEEVLRSFVVEVLAVFVGGKGGVSCEVEAVLAVEAVVGLGQDFALVERREFSNALDLPALLEARLEQCVLGQLLAIAVRDSRRGRSLLQR